MFASGCPIFLNVVKGVVEYEGIGECGCGGW